jgi:hypothetical protein
VFAAIAARSLDALERIALERALGRKIERHAEIIVDDGFVAVAAAGSEKYREHE